MCDFLVIHTSIASVYIKISEKPDIRKQTISQTDWTGTGETRAAKISVNSMVTALSRSLVANERKEKQVGVSLITYTPHLNSGRTDISTLSCEHRKMKIDFSVTEAVTVMFTLQMSFVFVKTICKEYRENVSLHSMVCGSII